MPEDGTSTETGVKVAKHDPSSEVLMDVPTGWNSAWVMLRRASQLKAPMKAVHVALRTMQDGSDHLKDVDTHWFKDE
ncbi:hypothetical protein BGX21_011259 [Mortierella sp. AD011]|nr:hypothetical protein BGX20_011166 [Mortierella sp. AD010]KAF9391375.1 hypothetical protein BGX21_011259 [Mortierella sp. AD011]